MKSKEACLSWLHQVFKHYSEGDISNENKKELWEVHETIEALINDKLQTKKMKLILGLHSGKEIDVELSHDPSQEEILKVMNYYKADSYRIETLF